MYRNRPVIIYNNGTSDIPWGGNRYFHRDTTIGNLTEWSVNITNNTSPWHLIGMQDKLGMTFQQLEDELGNSSEVGGVGYYDGNVNLGVNITDVDGENPIPSMAYTNKTLTVPYFPTFGTPYNNTNIKFAETFWLEKAGIYNSICYNWSVGDLREC